MTVYFILGYISGIGGRPLCLPVTLISGIGGRPLCLPVTLISVYTCKNRQIASSKIKMNRSTFFRVQCYTNANNKTNLHKTTSATEISKGY